MTKQPNILVFFTDDHAQWAAGCYGNEEIHTPNIDYLADTGVCMVNAFTPTPVCSPARACFHTGRIASQHGIHDYISSRDHKNDSFDWIKDEITIAEILSEAGYQTGISGKWHIGKESQPHPGFDSSFSLGGSYPKYHDKPNIYNRNGHTTTIPGHMTQVITDNTIKFLRDINKENPFFLFVGHYATHSPWEGHPERLVQKYRNCSFNNIPDDIAYPFGRQNLESLKESRLNPKEALAQYYASVNQIDESVGRILDELDAMNSRDNTLIIYTSDHGLNCSHHGIWGKGNGTLPLNMLEESIRIPLIFNQSGRLFTPQHRTEFVDHMDLFQTLLDYAGVVLPEKQKKERSYPGKSFKHLLENGKIHEEWRNVQFGEYGNLRMIRTRTHKLVYRYPDGPNELFDLDSDPRETINLYHDLKYQLLIKHLINRIDGYFSKYQDPVKNGLRVKELPVHNATESWRCNGRIGKNGILL